MFTECSARPLGVAAIAVAWGFVGLLVRWVDLPAVAIVTSRCALAALTIGVVLAVQRLVRARPERRPEKGDGRHAPCSWRSASPWPCTGCSSWPPSSGLRWAPCS